MKDPAVKYKKALRKNLQCTDDEKTRLMSKFDSMLCIYMEDNQQIDFFTLQQAFGPPEEMAKTLMNDVSSSELESYKKGRIAIRIIAGISAFLIIAFIGYFFFIREDPVEVIYKKEYTLTDNRVAVEEIIVYASGKSSDIDAVKKITISKNGKRIAIIAFEATFRCNNSNVQVVSKAVKQTVTYDEWLFEQT